MMDDETRAWVDQAKAADLRKLVQFLTNVSMEASVLTLQYASDPAGTLMRYEPWAG